MHAFGESIGVSKSKRHDFHPSVVLLLAIQHFSDIFIRMRVYQLHVAMLAGPCPLAS